MAVLLAYGLGRQLTMADGRVALLVAGILAFNPQFLFIMASVNNDVSTTVLGTAVVYVSIRPAVAPALHLFALPGGLVALGLLTKFALLAFWPLPELAVLWSVFRSANGVWAKDVSAVHGRRSNLYRSSEPCPILKLRVAVNGVSCWTPCLKQDNIRSYGA